MKEKVVFPNESFYSGSLASYWSPQESSLTPNCIVRPQSSEDVSTVLKLLGSISRYGTQIGGGRCQFAVRGGGHTPFAGSANIDKGVTVDLSQMNAVTVNENKSITSIGPGARWIDVYLKLDAMELAVPGGRVATVGVAGLITGGKLTTWPCGYSATNRYVCDTSRWFIFLCATIWAGL